jgi:hypothetical protein
VYLDTLDMIVVVKGAFHLCFCCKTQQFLLFMICLFQVCLHASSYRIIGVVEDFGHDGSDGSCGMSYSLLFLL